MVDQAGTLRLVDYDGVWVPQLARMARPIEIGHPNYERPGRQECITVAVFLSVTALRLSVARDSSGAATYRHLFSVGPVQAAGAARQVL